MGRFLRLAVISEWVTGRSFPVLRGSVFSEVRGLAQPAPETVTAGTAAYIQGQGLLELPATALYDPEGFYRGPMVTWDVVTEKRRRQSGEAGRLTGPERDFLFTMARMTGLRRSELASLTAASFVLGTDSFVIVEAGYSKHRERDVLPLHPDLVPLVRDWISQLHNGDPLFPLLEQRKTAQMMQVDLEAARIPYQDANGLYADFHALRHSFITGVWESGETPEVVMTLARHRSLAMTMRYTHVDRSAQVRAIKGMRSPLRKDCPR